MSPADVPDARLDSLGTAATELVNSIYRSLTVIGDQLLAVWATVDAGKGPRSAALAPIKATVVEQLSARGSLFNGAGVVMAEGILVDRERYLEWWRDDAGDHQLRRLVVNLDPRSAYYYDYSAMEWFVIPRDRDEAWVYGPYLDYAGAELYICTFAIPVRTADGTFLGIAGADVPVAEIELRLWPQLRAAGNSTVLVNPDGRVIVGNDPEYTTGSRIPSRVPATEPVRVPDTPWRIVPLVTQR